MPEYQQRTIDRVADLEAGVRQLQTTIDQLQREPSVNHRTPVERVRLTGKLTGGYYSETNYPDQSMTESVYELPAVFVDGTIPDDLADPFVWTPRSSDPQTKVISPGGWIPETIEPIHVALMRDGRYHVIDVPELRVVSNELVAADDYGEFSLWRNGADTGIDFVGVYLDWMHGGSSMPAGKEGRAYLDWDLRRWSIVNLEC